jgi:AcrR family transcriptional regulator
MAKKEKKGAGPTSPAPPRKGDIARQRILQAARKVFSRHPYKSASIRMVGKAGGFDHPLIHYYFPSKEKLFEAVAEELLDEFFEFEKTWYDGLSEMSLSESLAVFIDRVLQFHFKAPEVLRVIMQNMAHIDKLEDLPGSKYYLEYHRRMFQSFKKQSQLQASTEQIERFVHSFNVLINNYLGAGGTYAQVLHMEPDSKPYFAWVRETLLELFLPHLKSLLFPEGQNPD